MQNSALKRFSQLAIVIATVFGATGVATASGLTYGAQGGHIPNAGRNHQGYVHARSQTVLHSGNANSVNQHYQVGEIAPQGLRNSNHYVQNLSAHNLQRPPQGYSWFHSGNTGDYLLINQHTGRIAGVNSL
jgi:Ni/Co efflux regulator RcnB